MQLHLFKCSHCLMHDMNPLAILLIWNSWHIPTSQRNLLYLNDRIG